MVAHNRHYPHAAARTAPAPEPAPEPTPQASWLRTTLAMLVLFLTNAVGVAVFVWLAVGLIRILDWAAGVPR